jgi:hypothetical protein
MNPSLPTDRLWTDDVKLDPTLRSEITSDMTVLHGLVKSMQMVPRWMANTISGRRSSSNPASFDGVYMLQESD